MLVEGIVNDLFAYDPEFAKFSVGELPAEVGDLPVDVSALIARVWCEHPLSVVTTGAPSPAPSWEDFGRSYNYMLSSREPLSEDCWAAAANVAEEVGKTVQIAGVLLGVLVAAGWQGCVASTSGGEEFPAGEEFSALSRAAWSAWGMVFLPLARSLLEAKANWTVLALCRDAIDSLSSVGMPHMYSLERLRFLEQFRALAVSAARNINAASDELIWRLAELSASPDAAARKDLAALCWLLGDTSRARMLCAGKGSPSLDCLKFVVNRSLQAVPSDPFLEAGWQRMVDQGVLELSQELTPIYYRLTRATQSQLVQFDLATRVGFPPTRISRLVFDGLTALLAGRQSDIDMRSLQDAVEVTNNDTLLKSSLSAFVRFTTLMLLVSTPSAPTEEEREAERWKWEKLALTVSLALWWATVEGGEGLSADVSGDLPFSYLASRSPAELTSALELLEGYRAAGLEYSLTVTQPITAPAGDTATTSRDRGEARLRSELRGLRYLQVLGRLPTHAGRYSSSWEDIVEGGPLSPSLAFDKTRNKTRQLEVRQELEQTTGDILYRPLGSMRLRPGSGRALIDFHTALKYRSAHLSPDTGESESGPLPGSDDTHGPDQAFEQRLSMAKMLRDRDDFAGARVELERALTLAETVYGPNDVRVAKASTKLGNVLQDLNKYGRAKKNYERALAIHVLIYGQIHQTVATDRYNLGAVALELGSLQRSRIQLERAVAIDEGVYGTEHAEVAHDRMTLGMVLEELGAIAAARQEYERALTIRKAIYDPDHPAVADAANRLAAAEQLVRILEASEGFVNKLRSGSMGAGQILEED